MRLVVLVSFFVVGFARLRLRLALSRMYLSRSGERFDHAAGNRHFLHVRRCAGYRRSLHVFTASGLFKQHFKRFADKLRNGEIEERRVFED